MKTSAVDFLIKQLTAKKKLGKLDLETKMIIRSAKNIQKENILDAHYENGLSLTNAQTYYVKNYGTDIK